MVKWLIKTQKCPFLFHNSPSGSISVLHQEVNVEPIHINTKCNDGEQNKTHEILGSAVLSWQVLNRTLNAFKYKSGRQDQLATVLSYRTLLQPLGHRLASAIGE